MAYTYLIIHKETNTFYYGCRYSKNSKPEDLWSTYFTSSKYVYELIEKYGKDSFDYHIRKIFDDVDKCREWEHKVLRRMNVVGRNDFINRTDSKIFSLESCLKGVRNRVWTEEHKEIARQIGKRNKGKKRTTEQKKKMSEALRHNTRKLGVKESLETRLKKRMAKLGKPSNAVGNCQPRVSCLLCKHNTTTSSIKNHYKYHH